jgi:hypothetical protein
VRVVNLALRASKGATIKFKRDQRGWKGASTGHGHLVGRYGDLCLSETKVLQLATCTMSKQDYIRHLKDIGEIPLTPDDVDG